MSATPRIFEPDNPQPNGLVTRRRLVEMAGVTLVGTALFATTGCASREARAASTFPHVPSPAMRPESVAGVGIGTLNGGTKPVYVASPGSTDPVEHSVADTLFWAEQMMEHAMFFVMLMPGPELARPRGQAEQFQRDFAAHLAGLRRARLDRSNFVAFNGRTLALVRSLVVYKRAMQQAQQSGELRSLVWPQFFDHTAHEAERFMARLTQLNRGDAAFSRAEMVPFWSQIMDEHSLFIAHLLDPEEQALIDAARLTSETFRRLRSSGASAVGANDPVRTAVDEIIDFKTAAERGIQTGRIRSIIHPALADHVRREAVRFRDELTRAV
jgi:DUF2935 family protein